MTPEREIGYQISNVAWHKLDGYKELWKKAPIETKVEIINEQGKIAVEHRLPTIDDKKRWLAEFSEYLEKYEMDVIPSNFIEPFLTETALSA
jgi:hypothetical protein